MQYFQMRRLLGKRFIFWGWTSGFSERRSQDLSNGANVASQLVNFFCLHIYSLWESMGGFIILLQSYCCKIDGQDQRTTFKFLVWTWTSCFFLFFFPFFFICCRWPYLSSQWITPPLQTLTCVADVASTEILLRLRRLGSGHALRLPNDVIRRCFHHGRKTDQGQPALPDPLPGRQE